MLNERLAAARLVREALTAVEVDLEQSLVNANKLSITLLKARAMAKVPISTGSDALSQVATTIGHLYAAYDSMVDAHGNISAATSKVRRLIDVAGPYVTVRPCYL